LFEYWAHALVSNADLRRVLSRIRRDGALTIRDIDNDVLVEKDYTWGRPCRCRP
jgi:hypothetical protein